MDRITSLTTIAITGLCLGCLGVGLLAPALVSADTGKGTITITTTGFKSKRGQAIVALYQNSDSWLDLKKAYRVQKVSLAGKKTPLTVRFRDVPHGTYAVSVLHDENRNSKLDMRWFPYPKPEEAAGVSNNQASFGKPSYSKAKFVFARPSLSLRIKLVD